MASLGEAQDGVSRAENERHGHTKVGNSVCSLLRGGSSPFCFCACIFPVARALLCSFSCALTLADCVSARPIAFFAYAAGGQEASAAGLLSITAAQGLFPRFHGVKPAGNPPSTCVPRRFCTVAPFRLVPRRMEQVPSRLSHVGLTGAITMLSGTDRLEARSTQRRKAVRVSPFDFVEARGAQRAVRLGPNTFSLHLCW